jgi:hypothetical protein
MAYEETREIQETAQATVTELMAESIRLAITLANIVADEVIRARERRYELERQASEERARLDVERLRAERAAAEPLMRAVHQERFWRDLDPSRDDHRRRLGRAWQAASEWAGGDPYAAYTLDVMREQLRERFAIETPAWTVGGAELSRMVSLADPGFRKQLDKARAAAAETETVSYSVVIRDRDDPYTIAYQGEVTVPAAVGPDEAAARVYTEWAAGEGAAVVQGREDRYDVELRENTGSAAAVAVPAAVLPGAKAGEVLAAAESRRHALVAGTEQGSDAELLHALSTELDRLEAEEAQRRSRRAAYAVRLDDADLPDADRERLQRNIKAIDEGLPSLHQEQAETALRTAATAAQMRGENPAHVYGSARLTESLDEGWWATASPAEIAGVWDHVSAWQTGQARDEMLGTLREGVERHHRMMVPKDATSDMVAALYGGRDVPGPAVPLSAHGEVLREQAHALYEAAFDDYAQAAMQRGQAAETHGEDQAAALRHSSEYLTERAERTTGEATQLMEQGTWLELQTPEVLRVLYQENSSAAVDQLAAQFEEQWGRPLVPEARSQAAEAVGQIETPPTPWQVPAEPGSANPSSFLAGRVVTVSQRAVETVISVAESGVQDGGPATGTDPLGERQRAATEALSGIGDTEAREAAGLARKAFPEGAEEAVARPPQSGPNGGSAGQETSRQKASEAQL